MFSVGFNKYNLEVFDSLVSEDFEFYHDQSGITSSKQQFMDITRNNLCKLDDQPIRLLVDSTLVVYPLKNNGVLYGAFQRGTHRFYAKYENSDELKLTSEARFSHLWLLDDGKWKLSRVVSYDHVPYSD